MGDGSGGLDFQSSIFQKIMAEARRRAKMAASASGPFGALRACKLQKPISKDCKRNRKKKLGGGGGGGAGGWWRAALRFLRWDRGEDCSSPSNEEKPKPRPTPAPAMPPGVLYFVSSSSEPYGQGRCWNPRKKRALRSSDGVVRTGIMSMVMLTTSRSETPYLSLGDLNAVNEGGRNRLIAMVARRRPPPPIYWVT